MNEYLRAFVIGSSYVVFLPFFFAVSTFKREKFNGNYKTYTFFAPPTLGIMNVISLYVSKLFNLSTELRFLITSLLAPTIVLCCVIYFHVYNYTKQEWILHIFMLYLVYFIVFNVVIQGLDKYV